MHKLCQWGIPVCPPPPYGGAALGMSNEHDRRPRMAAISDQPMKGMVRILTETFCRGHRRNVLQYRIEDCIIQL